MFTSTKNSRIYVASCHKVMFVSLKKQALETVFESESYVFQRFLLVTENFWILQTTFNDVVILERKSNTEFTESKTIKSETIPRCLKLIIPDYHLYIYDFNSREDLVIKKRENKQMKIAFKTFDFLPYSDSYCILVCTNSDNEMYLLMFNIKLNSIEASLELPKYFKPVSLCLNETRDKLVVVAMRKGEQDLVPTDKSSFGKGLYSSLNETGVTF